MIELRVNGQVFRGWTSARVSVGIEHLAGTFSLSLVERWAGQSTPWPIREGDECSLAVSGVTLITGYVDERSLEFNATGHTVGVTGRDRAGDLVDCSALLDKWEFHDTDVLSLAKKICDPFGIAVTMQAGLSVASVSIPKKHSIDPGDTAAGALENLCRIAGLLAVSDGLGGVVLTRAGTTRAASTVVEGVNVKSASATFNVAGRFHRYEVMGSHKGRDDLSDATAAGVKGTAYDGQIRASRVLVVRPEGNVTTAQAKARAGWEASVRVARGDRITALVPGWTQSDGKPWRPNQLVGVKLPTCQVNGNALISRVTFALDPTSGTTTELELRNPGAFSPDPTFGKGGGGNNYWPELVKGV